MLNLISNFITGFIYSHWKGSLLTSILLAAAIYVGIQTHRLHEAQKEKQAAETNANAARQQKEGLQIIVNTQSMAANIEVEKGKANEQANNSNISADNFGASVNRDSGTFSGNFSESKQRFCRNFPEDSKCK